MDALINTLQAALAGHVKFALVYGSVLTKYFNRESDLDVAVFLGRKLSWQEHAAWPAQISAGLDHAHEVDLVVLDTADPIIAMQILANGKLIYVADRAAYLAYKVKMISQYLDFKYDRKIIEDRMAAGSIYA